MIIHGPSLNIKDGGRSFGGAGLLKIIFDIIQINKIMKASGSKDTIPRVSAFPLVTVSPVAA